MGDETDGIKSDRDRRRLIAVRGKTFRVHGQRKLGRVMNFKRWQSRARARGRNSDRAAAPPTIGLVYFYCLQAGHVSPKSKRNGKSRRGRSLCLSRDCLVTGTRVTRFIEQAAMVHLDSSPLEACTS